MRKMTLDEIRSAVKELSKEERDILMQEFFSESEERNPEIEKAWVKESKRRYEEIKSGKVKTIPGHVVRAEVRKMING